MDKYFEGFGTIQHIKIFEAEKAFVLEEAENRIKDLEKIFSAFLPDSDIGRLNRSMGKEFVRVEPETFQVLLEAKEFAKITKGLFDPTVRPLVNLWGINKKLNVIPDKKEIAEAKKCIQYKKISMKSSQEIKLGKNQQLDLGSFVKGYGADCIVELLRKNQVKDALLNLGGNIVVMGTKMGKPWRVGIQNPLKKTGETLGTVEVTDKTVVTSGVNQQFFMKNGVFYHHILDPRTGYPGNSGVLSVTVIGPVSREADALSTALFLLGDEKGMKFLEKYNQKYGKNLEVIYIKEDLEIVTNVGKENKFIRS